MNRRLWRARLAGGLVAFLVLLMVGSAVGDEGIDVSEQWAYEPLEEGIEAETIAHLATRSGPSTEYRDTGTYRVKGETVRVLSVAYDVNDVCWLQCEVPYRNGLRRVYTGLKRFDTDSFDLYDLPVEEESQVQARTTAQTRARYGPGGGYGYYSDLTLKRRQIVTVLTVENDYAQVEWEGEIWHRAWVPVEGLTFLP